MNMFRFFSTLEKVLILVLLVVILSTSYYLYGRYIREHSELIAVEGGIYTEGVVGRPFFLNPALLSGNPVDRDFSQLLFSGLTRYNPHTGLIEDDIATSEKSNDNLTYTFTLVPDARWHDGTPVTADDVVFTYQDIFQNDDFSNDTIKQTFSHVIVSKLDEHSVSFRLSEPNSFFLANVTLGILPKHYLEFVPVANLDKSEFNQQPIGSGPYRFLNWSVLNDTHEITLQKFDNYYGALPKIHTVIIRSFPDYASLLVAENTLTGFRVQGAQSPEDFLTPASRFVSFPYQLPQYTALFLNIDSPILSNKKVRFALLLATNKDEFLDVVQDAEIVDTPILESKADLDIEYSLERSRGAFFDTEWSLPGKRLGDGPVKASEDATGGPIDLSIIQEAEMLDFSLTSVQDTWLSLSIDGVAQKSFLFTVGQERSYKVKSSLIFMTVGNAAGLSLEVNGLPLKSLGGDGIVLRNLVFDRTTLSQYLVDTIDHVSDAQNLDPALTTDTPVSTQDEDQDAAVDPSSVIDESVVEVNDEDSLDPVDASVMPVISDEMEMVRVNDSGERLILRLVTAQEPISYLKIAELIRKQWLQAGAKVVIETYSNLELQERIADRDYDILLFGQNLGYNLDAFPFWHSSQVENGLNLSQYRSLEVDKLLVDIRQTFDDRTRQVLLDRLKKTIALDTPAVFLYNPLHFYLVDSSVRNVELAHLSSHSDRLSDLLNWFIKEDYELSEEFSFGELFRWMFSY